MVNFDIFTTKRNNKYVGVSYYSDPHPPPHTPKFASS